MKVLALEVRDRATFLPVFAIQMTAGNEEQRFLLRRAGYGLADPLVMLGYLGASGNKCCYDPYDWNDRTKQTAHKYIWDNFDKLVDGDVIDVEYILGETTEKKISERLGG